MTNEQFEEWIKDFEAKGYVMIDEAESQGRLTRIYKCLEDLKLATNQRSIDLDIGNSVLSEDELIEAWDDEPGCFNRHHWGEVPPPWKPSA